MDASAGLLGQAPPMSLCRSRDVLERLAGDVAFHATHDLSGVHASGSTASHIVASCFV
jgi:hypothetical protein